MTGLRRGPTPYYHQISSILRSGLITVSSVRETAPSEEELRQAFSVSRATVRQALAGWNPTA